MLISKEIYAVSPVFGAGHLVHICFFLVLKSLTDLGPDLSLTVASTLFVLAYEQNVIALVNGSSPYPR